MDLILNLSFRRQLLQILKNLPDGWLAGPLNLWIQMDLRMGLVTLCFTIRSMMGSENVQLIRKLKTSCSPASKATSKRFALPVQEKWQSWLRSGHVRMPIVHPHDWPSQSGRTEI